MKDTYTYTARSADDPDEVATFTLHDHSLSVELGGALLAQVERLFQPDDAEGEKPLPPWLKPALSALIPRLLRPFSVADVTVSVKEDGLWIRAWVRAGGLRLAPMTVEWSKVDNPDAAQAFVKELNKRKVSAAHPGRFPGPLDYWGIWVLMGFLVLILPLRWLGGADDEAT
ncbi:MAG: hypothetical protein ACE5F6_09480 [Anaerolineae bacterium]